MLDGHGGDIYRLAADSGCSHASPNAGYPEAAFAGALSVKLGGPNVYHGQRVDKPYIGQCFEPVAPHHIRKGCDLMLLSTLLWAAIVWAATMLK